MCLLLQVYVTNFKCVDNSDMHLLIADSRSFHSAALASASAWGLTSMTMFRASARTRALSVLFTGQSHGFLVLSLPLAHLCSSQRRGMRWSCHWRHRLPWYVAGHRQQRRLSYLYRFLLIGIDNLADYNNNDAMSSFSCT